MGRSKTSSPGNEHSRPRALDSRSVDGLAAFITGGKAKKVVVMTGAGISTSAGIPDFRSPETGLYANLARLNLPYAEAVFDISYFRKNPLPFYTLAHELYPGKYRPTLTHSFIKLLQDKGLLLKHFTQNIDCLDREAGVKDEFIIEAHGSFARQSCIECSTSFPNSQMMEYVKSKKVPHCAKTGCDGLVKPDIVFFGEALPVEFFMNRQLPGKADLCIIMGTSLTVHPFASLPNMVSEGVPRVLINNEQVGSLGSRPDDVVLLEDCDEGVRRLAAACGWLDELEAAWRSTAPLDASAEKSPQLSKDDLVTAEVNKLTKEIDETLKISRSLSSDNSDKSTAVLPEGISTVKDRQNYAQPATENAKKLDTESEGASGAQKQAQNTEKGTDVKKPSL